MGAYHLEAIKILFMHVPFILANSFFNHRINDNYLIILKDNNINKGAQLYSLEYFTPPYTLTIGS